MLTGLVIFNVLSVLPSDPHRSDLDLHVWLQGALSAAVWVCRDSSTLDTPVARLVLKCPARWLRKGASATHAAVLCPFSPDPPPSPSIPLVQTLHGRRRTCPERWRAAPWRPQSRSSAWKQRSSCWPGAGWVEGVGYFSIDLTISEKLVTIVLSLTIKLLAWSWVGGLL